MFVKDYMLYRSEKDKIGIDITSLLNAMLDMKAGKIKDRMQGICGNLLDVTFNAQEIVQWLALDWKHHSGDETYPVPSTVKGRSHRQMYNQTEIMWTKKTKYSALRMNLLDHCINKLRGMHEVDKLQREVDHLMDRAKRRGLVFEVSVKTDKNNPSMNNREMVSSVRVARGNY